MSETPQPRNIISKTKTSHRSTAAAAAAAAVLATTRKVTSSAPLVTTCSDETQWNFFRFTRRRRQSGLLDLRFVAL
jgi:hypothetical protein